MLVFSPEMIFIVLVFAYWAFIFIVLVFAYWAFTEKMEISFNDEPISGKLIGWTLITSDLLVIAIKSIIATYM